MFRNEPLDCYVLSKRAVAHVRDYFSSSSSQSSRNLLLNNFTNHDGRFLFTAGRWNRDLDNSGASFYIINFNSNLSDVGCNRIKVESEIETEALALRDALFYTQHESMHNKHIFFSYAELNLALKNGNPNHIWRLIPVITNIINLISSLCNPQLYIIPRSEAKVATSLATHGASMHELTLFQHGRDLSRWIMKNFLVNGIHL